MRDHVDDAADQVFSPRDFVRDHLIALMIGLYIVGWLVGLALGVRTAQQKHAVADAIELMAKSEEEAENEAKQATIDDRAELAALNDFQRVFRKDFAIEMWAIACLYIPFLQPLANGFIIAKYYCERRFSAMGSVAGIPTGIWLFGLLLISIVYVNYLLHQVLYDEFRGKRPSFDREHWTQILSAPLCSQSLWLAGFAMQMHNKLVLGAVNHYKRRLRKALPRNAEEILSQISGEVTESSQATEGNRTRLDPVDKQRMQSALWAALYFAILMGSFWKSGPTGQIDHNVVTGTGSFCLSLIGAAGIYNLLCTVLPAIEAVEENKTYLERFKGKTLEGDSDQSEISFDRTDGLDHGTWWAMWQFVHADSTDEQLILDGLITLTGVYLAFDTISLVLLWYLGLNDLPVMGLGVVSVLGHGILFVRLCDVCIGLNHVCDETESSWTGETNGRIVDAFDHNIRKELKSKKPLPEITQKVAIWSQWQQQLLKEGPIHTLAGLPMTRQLRNRILLSVLSPLIIKGIALVSLQVYDKRPYVLRFIGQHTGNATDMGNATG
ncbi:unnamed protein product [Effrenium voratum]|uniref:Uncharacterized protein n=1 Tax=Effrenium voratum TaxID=2562239 RepID=A0AA36IP59_9DINO|nr:unnamed protein product [Effrenium voratum]